MSYQFKEGDCVMHTNDDTDIGTFIKYNNDYTCLVDWNIDGVQSAMVECLYLVNNSTNKEQEAVMLLLNLGYMVSKNS